KLGVLGPQLGDVAEDGQRSDHTAAGVPQEREVSDHDQRLAVWTAHAERVPHRAPGPAQLLAHRYGVLGVVDEIGERATEHLLAVDPQRPSGGFVDERGLPVLIAGPDPLARRLDDPAEAPLGVAAQLALTLHGGHV